MSARVCEHPMNRYENLAEWKGRPVLQYEPGEPIDPSHYYCLRLDYDSELSMAELMASFLADPSAPLVTGILIGAWFGDDPSDSSAEAVELLVGARHVLQNLEAIFFGEISVEQCEISWITQSDISPILSAYPKLKHLAVRGGNGLSVGGHMRLEELESLTIETGGMPGQVVREVTSFDLPNLKSLELWLGTPDYGGTVTLQDVQPILDGGLFPKMTSLGLKDAEIADQVAEAVAKSSVVHRLEELDLSMGTMGDAGAEHLLTCPALKRLRKLNLNHHYCTPGIVSRLQAEFPIATLDDVQDEGKYGRWVEVGE